MPLKIKDLTSSLNVYVNQSKDPIRVLEDSQAQLLFENMVKELRIYTLEETQSEMLFDMMEIRNGLGIQ